MPITSKKPTRKTQSLKPKKTARLVQETTPEPVTPPATVSPEPGVNEPAAAVAIAKPPKKTVAPKKAKAAKPAKAGGKSVAIYLATLKNPEKSAKEIAEIVIGSGVKSSPETIGTIRSDFIRAVNFLDDQGLLKSPFKQA